ncbi:LOW QUALITY PROTEIN: hypothetical protein SETIT_5G095100v2 [Setaria italica]|uniref:Wall-associated receptor kinase galacturonan-binding domain-containing protein n=1 Tax=Setaria italica TaxID=4555 RepID=A0A368R4T3_SETIT|nr:LOW QUALITY PROTEIN: hypothetical protein SETIT_5G095100v2 [Setaria italica]
MAPSSLLLFLVSSVPGDACGSSSIRARRKGPRTCGMRQPQHLLPVCVTLGGSNGVTTQCSDSKSFAQATPFTSGFKVSFQILNIFYGTGSLFVADVYKLHDFNSSAPNGCHAPGVNVSTKLGSPFSISPVNQNLIFYNCTNPAAEEERQKRGLVGTACRNNTFVRAGGRYDETRGRAATAITFWRAATLPSCRCLGILARRTRADTRSSSAAAFS